ncbi:hypothetical protein NMG60_11009690 [Bertholletia excelsa]
MEHSVTESDRGSIKVGDLKIHPDPKVNDVELSMSRQMLRSSSSNESSSSPNSPLDYRFQEDGYETEPAMGTTQGQQLHKDGPSTIKHGENNGSGSSTSFSKQSNYELPISTLPSSISGDSLFYASTTESPPVQVKDSLGDSPYRISSNVFSRTRSKTTPAEWSLASDESLFSIHEGMSSRDQVCRKSEDRSLPPESTKSTQMSNKALPGQTTYVGSSFSEGDTAKADVGAVEVMKESAEDKSKGNSSLTPSMSVSSDTSIKSFAFPILTGESVRGVSVIGSPKHMQPMAQVQIQPQSRSELEPQIHPQPLRDSQPRNKPKSHSQVSFRKKWFSCFMNCKFCS